MTDPNSDQSRATAVKAVYIVRKLFEDKVAAHPSVVADRDTREKAHLLIS